MNSSAQQAKKIFLEAIEIGDVEERESFLGKACGGDSRLRERVDRLIAAHDQDDSLFDRTASAPLQPTEKLGQTIGPYKLLQKIGEGGMGAVYMAEQENPVRRVVALKIIKPGMDSRQVIARFEAERQALAMMDHNNIAKVLDAGTTDAGRPYFAMELVKGVPITAYCDGNKLTLRERLQMFIPVCQAIQHAHQKGVIHRDIKPSNVLVTLYDGNPVAKVIDFGIAKATQQKLTERTMFTGLGQILGTFEYMSPEQAEMNQLDIDTRSDVYSLGVMLYELLTGSTPISKEELRKVGIEEMLRTIRATDPPKPSTRISESSQTLPSISDARKTDPTKLSKFLRGDLDWIVMKALEKDRTRRYETANGLAMDVERFLKDEAVEACPPSSAYRFRKFVRRNRTMVAAAATVAGVLVACSIVSSALAVWALRAEQVAADNEAAAIDALDVAGAAQREEQKQREIADENARQASLEAAKSKQVAAFLKEMLKGVGPSVALGRDTTMLKEILESTTKRVSAELADQPEIQAELRATLGEVYRELGEFDQAEEQLRGALRLFRAVHGDLHASVADVLQHLGELPETIGSEEATQFLGESLRIRTAVFGEKHPATASSLLSIGQRQSDRFRRNNEGLDGEPILSLLGKALATYQSSKGDHDLPIAKTLIGLSAVNGTVAGRLTEKQEKEARYAKCLQLLNRAVTILRRRDGDDFRQAEAEALIFIGWTHQLLGNNKQANLAFQQSLGEARSTAAGRVGIPNQLRQFSAFQHKQAHYQERVATLDRLLREANRLFGAESPRAANYQQFVGVQMYNLGYLDKAHELLTRAPDSLAGHLWDTAYILVQGEDDPRRAREAADIRRRLWNDRDNVHRKEQELGPRYSSALCLAGEIDEAVAIHNEAELAAAEGLWYETTVLNLISGESSRNLPIFGRALAAGEQATIQQEARVMERAARAVLIDSMAAPELVARAARLVERATEIESGPGGDDPRFDLSLALARYRQRRYEEVERLTDRVLASEKQHLRRIALTLAAMSHLQQGERQSAEERVDELGLFSVLPTSLPAKFRYTWRVDFFAAWYLQSELRSLLATDDLDSASTIQLGLRRQSRHVERHPDDMPAALQLLRLYVWFRESDEHHHLFRRLIADPSNLKDTDSQYRLAQSFLLYPSSDVGLILKARNLAQQAADSVNAEQLEHEAAVKLANYQLTLALAEIRLGNNEDAQAWLDRTEPIVTLPHRGRWGAISSINYSQKRRPEMARAALAVAEEMIWPGPSRETVSFALVNAAVHESEQDIMAGWLLLEEARETLDIP